MRLVDFDLPNRFELVRIAGSGGMGTVYQVKDPRSGELYALKVVNRPDPESDRRFDREQRLLAQLDSPHIVKYIDHGRLADGRPWLAMEWLAGYDLGEYLRTRTMGLGECLRFGAKVATALVEAHRVGVIHRDLKPRNVLLVDRAASRPKLIDFGIALAVHSTPITSTGAVLGTLGFVSPEQLAGSRGTDPRTDLYALGCLLFCCLTGRPPVVSGNLPELLTKILRNDLPHITELRPETPAALAELITRLLARELAARPASAAEVAQQLEAMISEDDDLLERDTPRMTYSERRLRTVLVGRSNGSVQHEAPTVDLHAVSGDVDHGLGPFAEQHELQLERGTTFFWLAAPHVASSLEEAQRLAQVALILAEQKPQYALALLTTLVQADRPSPLGALVNALPAPATGDHSDDGRAEILVDRDTEALLRGRFILAPSARGTRLVAEAPLVEPTQGSDALPFVGRRFELGLLRDARRHVHEERAAQLVLISASPGLGKSRLCRELVAHSRAESPGLQCWGSRLDPVDGGVPYAMARSLLASVADAEQAGPLSLLRERLAGVSATSDETTGENPERLANLIREAWLTWVATALTRRPLLWILEDMQWADAASVQLIEATVDACRALPLFIVATTRPEASAALSRSWRHLPMIEVRLGPLRTAEALELLRSASREATAPLPLERLVEQSGGNPLYLEELARSDLRREVTIPVSLVGLLEARVLDLMSEEKLVLRAASVIGERFSRRDLELVLDGHGLDVAAVLRQLTQRELLTVAPRIASGSDEEYAFRHALTREAAYATLVDADRVLAHRRVAAFLAEQPDPVPAVLALHCDRGERFEQAAEAYARAAEVAFSTNDRPLLLRFAADAMRCGLTGEPLGRLKLRLAASHRWHGDFANARQQASEALALAPPRTTSWFSALLEVVNACSALGDYEHAIELAQELRFGDEPAHAIEPQRLASLAAVINALLNGGQVVSAERLTAELDRLCPDPERLGGFVGGTILRAQGSLARHRGLFERDHFAYVAAVRCFQAAGETSSELSCRVAVGFSLMELGQPLLAEAELLRVRLMAAAASMGSVVTRVDHNLALILAGRGEFDEAVEREQSAIAAARSQHQPRLQAWSLVYLSFILQRRGDLAGSLAAARQVATVAKAPPAAVAGGAAQQARVELAAGSPTAALALSTAAYAILRTMRYLEEFEPLIRLAHIECLLAAGRRDEARAHTAKAHHLLMRSASAISNPLWRESFLRRDPITQALVTLYAELDCGQVRYEEIP